MQSDITIYAESVDDISANSSSGLLVSLNNVDVKTLLDEIDADDLINHIEGRSEVYDELYQKIKEEIKDGEYAYAEDQHRG